VSEAPSTLQVAMQDLFICFGAKLQNVTLVTEALSRFLATPILAAGFFGLEPGYA
jgi:hypothetical protein